MIELIYNVCFVLILGAPAVLSS